MASDLDLDLDKELRQSNARFMASISRIFERYNHPFEDDLLISMETLTYDTPDGPKKWGAVSSKKLKKWKKEVLKGNRSRRKNTDMSKHQSSDFEDGHSTVHQESPENSHMDTSDIDRESDADIVSVRRKFEDISFQNLYGDDRKNQEQVKVQVDVIVQDYAREIPKWITVAPQGSSEGLHLASPVQELNGNQAAVCRKKVELSSECSSSRPLQLQFSGVPISPNTVTIPRQRPSPELNKTCYDYILEEYQSADEECSWSNVTLGDLYPAMVEIFKRLMTKESRRKELKHMFGHLRHRKWHSRRPKLNITVDKIRGFRPFKLKKALPSICSSRSEDIQNQTFGNENRELCDDMCSIIKFFGPVPCSCMDTNKIKMGYSDSSLEHHLVSGKEPKVSKQTIFPDVMIRMGERFLVEDGLQTTVSLKNSKCKACEKLACKCSLEYHFIGSTARAGSTDLALVKESKTQKMDFPCDDTSELCSSTCSSHGNRNTFTPVTSCSLVKVPNTFLISPEKIPESQISFQLKHSFSSSSMKQSPSKIPQKYEDAFDKLYYKLCCKETQKPLTLARPLSNSQNLEEKGRLVNSNLSDSVRSNTQYDREFDRIYEQLCSATVPKLSGFQRASNLRKYEGIQMSETVNALVNSPVRTLSAIPRVKRLGNFQNDHLFSPVKRLKNTPECCFPSKKCQQISHRKNVNLQTADMDFLSTYNDSYPGSFGSHNCQCQDSGFHTTSDKIFLCVPDTSMQESGIADPYSDWPRATMNCSSPRNAQKRDQRVSRKLSYADGKD